MSTHAHPLSVLHALGRWEGVFISVISTAQCLGHSRCSINICSCASVHVYTCMCLCSRDNVREREWMGMSHAFCSAMWIGMCTTVGDCAWEGSVSKQAESCDHTWYSSGYLGIDLCELRLLCPWVHELGCHSMCTCVWDLFRCTHRGVHGHLWERLRDGG